MYNNTSIPSERILSRLDEYFSKNDYDGAEKHLKYWFDEALAINDLRGRLLLCNELIGLSRKRLNEKQTFEFVTEALDCLKLLDMENSVAAATTYINSGTAYKAFGRADEGFLHFEMALEIYQRELDETDSRMGGLYNNMALALVDLGRFEEAYILYDKAICIMEKIAGGELEMAITYLNIASAKETEFGLLDGEEEIENYIKTASKLLDVHKNSKDGYYAFVCEKCASVFGYYGYFIYEKELRERALKIYEGN